MINENEAIKIATQYLSILEKDIGEALEMDKTETIEKEFGWVFFYNSKDYIETGNFRSMLGGNAPFIVNRNNGEICVTETSKPIDEYIVDYQSKWNENSQKNN